MIALAGYFNYVRGSYLPAGADITARGTLSLS